MKAKAIDLDFPVSAKKVRRALLAQRPWGYGSIVGTTHTWPISLTRLAKFMGLSDGIKPALGRLLREMQQRHFKEFRVRYAYYPTGWRVEYRRPVSKRDAERMGCH